MIVGAFDVDHAIPPTAANDIWKLTDRGLTGAHASTVAPVSSI
jgi:hypothetical protein|tara:strand:- start:211 stop:339 length:129 start_codon:yes stop_codon:yes gene_type:complete